MCTVTFIPTKEVVYLTSNRDERAVRNPAEQPRAFLKSACRMIYPRDGEAGGTWITLCNNGNAGVLLNGAFEKHERQAQYTRSRGLVLLDIMDHPYPLHRFFKMSLSGIEAFTLILWAGSNLYECRWDETERHCKPLKAYRPYIWSSATLYNAEVRRKREQWFLKFLNTHPAPTQAEILTFHRTAGNGGIEEDVFRSLANGVSTVSVTSIALEKGTASMGYTDVKEPLAAPPAFLDLQPKRA